MKLKQTRRELLKVSSGFATAGLAGIPGDLAYAARPTRLVQMTAPS